MSDPDVSVLIVSHGHGAMVRECLQSLPGCMEGLTWETIVVDNLGEPSFREQIGNPDGNFTLITNRERLGFGANTNRAARQARGRILLILNPDTLWHSGALADAIEYLEADPARGIVAALLLNRDLSVQGNYRAFTSLPFVFLRGIGADGWRRQPRLYTEGKLEQLSLEAPAEVDWVYGSFMLIRRATFEAAGGFDEGFFMYYEDVDLCYRLRKAGLRTVIFPRLRFIHDHQRTSSEKPFSSYRLVHLKSVLRYLWKTGAWFGKPARSSFPSGPFEAEKSRRALARMKPDNSPARAGGRAAGRWGVALFIAVMIGATLLAGLATRGLLMVLGLPVDALGPALDFSVRAFAAALLLAQFMLQELDPLRLGDRRRRVIGVIESSLMAGFLVALILVIFRPALAAEMGPVYLLFMLFAVLLNGIATWLFSKSIRTPGARIGVVMDGSSLPNRPEDIPEIPIGLQTVAEIFHADGRAEEDQAGEISRAISEDRLDHLLLLMEEANGSRALPLVTRLSMFDIPIWFAPRGGKNTTACGVIPLRLPMRSRAREGIKRGLDLLISLAALAILAAPMIVIAAAIRLESRGPVFFGQPRLGRNQVPFLMLKFRTMYADAQDRQGNRLTTTNDPRITRVGAFLRRTSLDELPQLLNVIHGDMSIVGPRPLPPGFHFKGRAFEEIIPEWHHRTRVRPGITGLAQLRGLRGTPDSFEEALAMMRQRVSCDNHYIERWSIWLDLRILVMTVLSGAFMAGAY